MVERTEPPGLDERRAPDRPTELGARGWWAVLKRTVREFRADNLRDWAAALTYYAVLSIFPGLLVLVSVLGLVGESAVQPLIDNLRGLAPGAVTDILTAGARSSARPTPSTTCPKDVQSGRRCRSASASPS